MYKAMRIQIPQDLDFAALKLSRDPVTLDVSFDWAPVQAICDQSGIDITIFRDHPEDNVAALLTTWYTEHRERGGAPDPVAEQIFAEVQAEQVSGQANVINHAGGLQ